MAKIILIADDEKAICDSLALFLSGEGYDVRTAQSGEDALAIMLDTTIDLLLADIRMPGIDGIELIRRTADVSPSASVIIMTAYASVDSAVEALRLGAFDYILKPIDLDELALRIRRLMRQRELYLENSALRRQLHTAFPTQRIVGTSRPMQKVFELISKVAGTKSNVLITGQSGTGKELVARAIHEQSERKDRLFLPVNCGAISESLIESELFGHKRGAFTDAYQDKQGVFQLADGGTLFLDEVGDIPLHLQVKLLRALDERAIIPVGGSLPIKVDARILCATNQDLVAKVRNGAFREDLFYRLNVVEIHLPPLKDRAEDIPLLVNHFLARYNAEIGKSILGVDSDAMRALLNHPWKGGVRELQNAIERGVIFCDGQFIKPADLPPHFSGEGGQETIPEDHKEAMKIFERNHIREILTRYSGNKEATAKALNLGLSSLYRKIDELSITPE